MKKRDFRFVISVEGVVVVVEEDDDNSVVEEILAG
jgi:hypothetical protein